MILAVTVERYVCLHVARTILIEGYDNKSQKAFVSSLLSFYKLDNTWRHVSRQYCLYCEKLRKIENTLRNTLYNTLNYFE